MQKIRKYVVTALAVLFSLAIWLVMSARAVNVRVIIEYDGEYDQDSAQMFFNQGNGFELENSSSGAILDGKAELWIDPALLSCGEIRIDPGTGDGIYRIKNIKIYSQFFKSKKILLGTICAEELKTQAAVLGGNRVEIENDGSYAIQDSKKDAAFLLNPNLTGKLVGAANNNWMLKAGLQTVLGMLYIVYLLWEWKGKKTAVKGGIAACCLLAAAAFVIFVFAELPDRYYIQEERKVQMPEEVTLAENKTFTGLAIQYEEEERTFLQKVKEVEVVFSVNNNEVYTKKISAEALVEGRAVSFVSDYLNRLSGETVSVEIRYDGVEEKIPVSVKFLYESVMYRWLILLTAVFGGGLVAFAILYKRFGLTEKRVIRGIYLLLLIFAGLKMWYYAAQIGQIPDEEAHVAYVAYLEKTGKLIPQFDEMERATAERLSTYRGGELRYEFDGRLNYLCHPPLYYHMLKLSGGVRIQEDGSFLADYTRLRGMSAAVMLAALALWFWVGYRYLDKRYPLQHLLFGTIIVSIPMVCFTGSGLNNDTLTFLGGALSAFGMLRFVQSDRDWKTYWAIALGVMAMLMGKVTAGAIIVLAVWGYLLWELMVRRKPGEIFRPAFWPTVPVYLLVILYFVMVYRQTGSIQPSYQKLDYEGYRNSAFFTEYAMRNVYSVPEYIKHALSQFLATWSGCYSTFFAVYKNTEGGWLFWLWPTVIWLIPLGLFRKKTKMEQCEKIFLQMLYLSVLLICLLQFKNGYDVFYFLSGYPGGLQSRYYLCVLGLFAYIWARENILFSEKKAAAGKIVNMATAVSAAIFLYGDFIYFLIKNENFYCL